MHDDSTISELAALKGTSPVPQTPYVPADEETAVQERIAAMLANCAAADLRKDAEQELAAGRKRAAVEESFAPNHSHMVRVGDVLTDAKDFFGRRFSGAEKPLRLPWAAVGQALGGGFWPGAHVITGSTAAGKTAFAIQVAQQAADDGHPVLYIGLELDTNQIIARLSALAYARIQNVATVEVHWSDIYLGKCDPAKVDAALESLRACPIYVEEAPPGGWSSKNMLVRVEELKLAHPEAGLKAPLVVLDFLQLVGPTDPASHRREELRERIGAAAYAGREVARKCGAVVLMISSISRAGAKELGTLASDNKLGVGDPADMVGLGKESGDIEFSADTVISLAREKRENGDTGPAAVWLALAKIRAGVPCWRLLSFNGSWLQESEDASNAAERLEERAEAKRLAKEEAANRRREKEYEARLQRILTVLQHAKSPMSIEAIQAKAGGAKNAYSRMLIDLEGRGLTQQVMVGRKSLGWAIANRSFDPDASGLMRTSPDESTAVRNPDGLSYVIGRVRIPGQSEAVESQKPAVSGVPSEAELTAYYQEMARQVAAEAQADAKAEDEAKAKAASAPDDIQSAIARGDDAEAERLSGVTLPKFGEGEDK